MSTSHRVYTELEEVPLTETALVLGTSKRFANGEPNTYFEHRMDAAASLFKEGKIKHLLLSGDNRTPYYNEPADMQAALEKRGIPVSAFSSDKAGLRTLDSVVRSNEIFGSEEILVVTQRFHTYRAVFIGQHYGINTYAYAAKSLPLRASANLLFREFLARPMAVIDLYILQKEPSEMGKEDLLEL
ncbi:SanA/YdcF family protein [Nafulsella turpanensis]|uniref:SanA/YdcF family protein n=1 Tax=Nafulsella turpanensis TaxID=1265690 RepID=UPI001F3DA03F|nr:ElyC/SanA/YdcF family protein [Nafulsella turpanensis]